MLPRLVTILAVLLASLALADAASAMDICVAPNTNCGQYNVDTFEEALAEAKSYPDADRIYLGADSYIAPDAWGYTYTEQWPIEIIGAGVGKTWLSAPMGANSHTLLLQAGDGSSIHDLGIYIPAGTSGYTGLVTTANVKRIAVIEHLIHPVGGSRTGVRLLSGGTLADSTVELNESELTFGVMFGHGMGLVGGHVRNSTVSAGVGVFSQWGGSVDRSRITGHTAIKAITRTTTVTRSVLESLSNDAVNAGVQYGIKTEVNLDGVAIACPDMPSATAIHANTSASAGETIAIKVVNSAIRGCARPLDAYAQGPGEARFDVSYTDFDPTGNEKVGPAAFLDLSNNTNLGAAAGFADAANGDFHLLPGSPLIDSGDPASEDGLDLDGAALIADGDGDGSARRDVGPLEAPPPPPPPPLPDPAPPAGQAPPPPPPPAGPAADTQPPVLSGLRATRRRARYSLSEPASVSIVLRDRTRRRTAAKLVRPSVAGANVARFKRALKPGRYRAVVSAVDAAGNRSAVKRLRFRVAVTVGA